MAQQSVDDFLGLGPSGAGTPDSSKQSVDSFLGTTAPTELAPGSPIAMPRPADLYSTGLHYLGLAKDAATKGVNGLLGTPGDLAALVGQRASPGTPTLNDQASGINNQLSLDQLSPAGALQVPPVTSGDLGKMTNQLGLTGRPQDLPQTPGEARTAAAITGAVAGAPFGPLSAAIGAGAGTSGELAHELAPNSKVLPIVAGIGTALAMHGAGTGVNSYLAGRQAIADELAAGQSLTAAQKAQAGVEGSVAGAPEVAQGAQEGAMSPGTLQEAKRQNADALDAALQRLEAQHAAVHATADQGLEGVAAAQGQSSTLEQAGTTLQGAARDWINNQAPQLHAAAWAPVDAAIPGTTGVPLNAFNRTLEDINTSAGGLDPVADLLKPSIPKALWDRLKAVGGPEGVPAKPAVLGESAILGPDGKPLTTVVSPAQEAQPFTWSDVAKLRTTLGGALSDPMLVKSVGEQNLSRLYGALTQDMGGVAGDLGAGQAFDAANQGSQALFKFAEGPLAKVISSGKAVQETIKPEDAANALINGGKKGATDLAALRQYIPGAVDDLGAAAVRQGKFTSLAPEAQSALVPGVGGQAQIQGHLAAKASADSALEQQTGLVKELKGLQDQYVGDVAKETKASGQAQIAAAKQTTNDAAQKLSQLQATRAAAAAPLNPLLGLKDSVVGSLIGPLVASQFGLTAGLGTAAGATAGALAPYAFQGAKALVKAPGALVNPLVGGLAGRAAGQ